MLPDGGHELNKALAMTLFRGGCSSLSKISDALAADTAAWLLRGDFRVQFADERNRIEIGPEEDVPPIQ